MPAVQFHRHFAQGGGPRQVVANPGARESIIICPAGRLIVVVAGGGVGRVCACCGTDDGHRETGDVK